MAGGVGHTGGLTNPRPWRRRCRAGFSNTGGPPLPRKRAPIQKSCPIDFYLMSSTCLKVKNTPLKRSQVVMAITGN